MEKIDHQKDKYKKAAPAKLGEGGDDHNAGDAFHKSRDKVAAKSPRYHHHHHHHHHHHYHDQKSTYDYTRGGAGRQRVFFSPDIIPRNGQLPHVDVSANVFCVEG